MNCGDSKTIARSLGMTPVGIIYFHLEVGQFGTTKDKNAISAHGHIALADLGGELLERYAPAGFIKKVQNDKIVPEGMIFVEG